MKNQNLIADEIKSRVKMSELVSRYGFEIQKGNRIPCPFHNGKNANLGIKDNYCHCFKCGYSGDVIKFVQDYYKLSFSEAVSKINEDFGLGLPIGGDASKRRQLDAARQAFFKKQEQKKKEAEHEKYMTEWLNAHGELIRLERQKREYRPRKASEELHPKFIEALLNIEYAKYRLGCAEEELINYEAAN